MFPVLHFFFIQWTRGDSPFYLVTRLPWMFLSEKLQERFSTLHASKNSETPMFNQQNKYKVEEARVASCGLKA